MRAIEKVHVRRAAPPNVPTTDHFFLKCGHELVRLDHDEVLYISAMRDYVAVHTRARGRFLSLEHLRDLEARLPAEHYCRIHRSHMVRIGALEKAHRDHVIVGGVSLPISDSYAQRFRSMVGLG
ncbi:MAG: LytTR family transcriptional regulator [Flavobacteriales bacterium]|nr:LytTR family transcriptional regulator [Flavobacteriales bacterium]